MSASNSTARAKTPSHRGGRGQALPEVDRRGGRSQPLASAERGGRSGTPVPQRGGRSGTPVRQSRSPQLGRDLYRLELKASTGETHRIEGSTSELASLLYSIFSGVCLPKKLPTWLRSKNFTLTRIESLGNEEGEEEVESTSGVQTTDQAKAQAATAKPNALAAAPTTIITTHSAMIKEGLNFFRQLPKSHNCTVDSSSTALKFSRDGVCVCMIGLDVLNPEKPQLEILRVIAGAADERSHLPPTYSSLRFAIESIVLPVKKLVIHPTTRLTQRSEWSNAAFDSSPTDAFEARPIGRRPIDKVDLVVVCGETGIGKSSLVAHRLPDSFRGDHPTLYACLSQFDRTAQAERPRTEMLSPHSMTKLNMVDAALESLVAQDVLLRKVAATIPGNLSVHPVVLKLREQCLDANITIHTKRTDRAKLAEELLHNCLDAAIEEQCPQHAQWYSNPDRDACSVTLAVDEIGKCLALVRGIASLPMNLLQQRLKEKYGFTFVNIVFAGTGTEAFQANTGVLRSSTDPRRVCLVNLRPKSLGLDFAKWAMQNVTGAQFFIDASVCFGLASLWTNTRMAVEFAQAIKSGKADVDAETTLFTAAQQAMVCFIAQNGLSNQTPTVRKQLLDVAYWSLFERDTVYRGVLATANDEITKLQEECQRFGLLRAEEGTYVVSAAILFALCTNVGVFVKPGMGAEFEVLCARAAARGCQISGYDTVIVKLSTPYLRAKEASHFAKAEAELIIRHLQGGRSGTNTDNAVVVMNGPSAQGPDVIVLKVRKRAKQAPKFDFVAIQSKNVSTVMTNAELEHRLTSLGIRAPQDSARAPKTLAVLCAFETLASQAYARSSDDIPWKLLKKLDTVKLQSYQATAWSFVIQESLAKDEDMAKVEAKIKAWQSQKKLPGTLQLNCREDLGPWERFIADAADFNDQVLVCPPR